VENERLNEEDPEVHALLQRQWYSIRSFSRFDTAILISNRHELVEFLQSIAEENFLIKHCRPDTSWKIFQIINITFLGL